MLYCHFPTRNGSKSPLKNQKKSARDYIGEGAFTNDVRCFLDNLNLPTYLP